MSSLLRAQGAGKGAEKNSNARGNNINIFKLRLLFTLSLYVGNNITKKQMVEITKKIEELRVQGHKAQEDGDYNRAMHIYEKCARELVEHLQMPELPEKYHNNFHQAIKAVLFEMDEILKETGKNHLPRLSNLVLNKELKRSLIKFLNRVRVSIKEDLDYEDSSILLYGPSGTGKTFIANAIAQELGVPFILVTPAEAHSKWSGDSAKYIRDIFKQAKQQGAVLFLDEIHKLLHSEDGDESKVHVDTEAQLLIELTGRDKSFWVLGATSRPWKQQ